jgi:hypothetical protein
MKSILLAFLMLALCCSCSLSTTKLIGPNGRENISITCMNDMDKCYGAANKFCPKGYSIMNQSAYSVGLDSKVNILIECK